MSLLESFRIAWESLLANKLRALLTMLGIIIGVSAVVGMLAIGNGLSAYLENEFGKLGVGVFYINPQVNSDDVNETRRPQLTADDAQALLSGMAPAVKNVVVEYSTTTLVSAGGERFFYTVQGITPSHFTITDNTLGAGRYYTDAEEQSKARVTVLGSDVATALFGSGQAALGQQVAVGGLRLEVVGILTTPPSQAGNFTRPTEVVYMPYSTARARLFRNELSSRVDVGRVTVQAQSREQVQAAIDQTTAILRERHRITDGVNDFTIDDPAEEAERAQLSIAGLSAFLGVIAGISLLVGGIGIMNIMLVSVTQRTREIGLRKAVGARPRDILQQFLIEAIVLCLAGGVLGIALGYVFSFAGTFVLENVMRAENARASVTLSSILLATGVSTLIGMFFGFFPAMRAARLQPIQALRKE